MTKKPRTPSGLATPGKKLWDSVTSEFDLAEHESVQLEEACRVRDMIFVLREQITRDGTMLESSQGRRLHPAIGEVRSQQLAMARLLATLNVPALEEDGLPASRGVRGIYSGRRAS
ncbi:terminase [Agromyces atrinae]|uniref:terminase n=1 Tax=Agromyces atrinae TaxID=592376 RepID=UPI001F572535|nr:terminase [Agromyces atrinae]MCI2959131.1 terminase [Agromyces atrinae]